MYVTSVVGSGVMIIPALAAQVAGPASLVSWLLLSLASYPFAYTFASLSARKPESGGVYAFTKESFGPNVANGVGWLFLAWYAAGAPANNLAAASYLSFALPLNRPEEFVVAALMIAGAFAINYLGIELSGKFQLGLVASIFVVLSLAVVTSAPRVTPQSFTPFLPNGLASIGVASALIVWSYFGYENVSNVAEEFKDPKRDFQRSVLLSVLIVSGLYLLVAATIVGTQAYRATGALAPFAIMLFNVLGPYAGIGTAIFAVVVIFGTLNVYTTGIARVILAVSRDHGMPSAMAKIHGRTGVPHRALVALTSSALIALLVYYFLRVDLQTGFLATSGSAMLVYVVGSGAGIRLLREKGIKGALPWTSLLVSLAILPFIGASLAISVIVGVAGYLYSRYRIGSSD